VTVLVMQVGNVPVTMPERLVHVRMRMRLGAVPRKVMRMLVMFVMHMRVGMRERLMTVFMFMVLREVQPHPGGHQ